MTRSATVSTVTMATDRPDEDAGDGLALVGCHDTLVGGDNRHEHEQHRQDDAVDELRCEA